MTLNEQPSAIAALTAAIGPSVGYHISECSHGGFIVIVDGTIHCARTTLPEAIAAMGEVAANRYGKSAVAPEHAAAVRGGPGLAEDDRRLDGMADAAARYGPRPPPMHRPPESSVGQAVERLRRTAQAVLVALVISSVAMWGRVA